MIKVITALALTFAIAAVGCYQSGDEANPEGADPKTQWGPGVSP